MGVVQYFGTVAVVVSHCLQDLYNFWEMADQQWISAEIKLEVTVVNVGVCE